MPIRTTGSDEIICICDCVFYVLYKTSNTDRSEVKCVDEFNRMLR